MKLLLKYGKIGPLKYLSHLELIRSFERAFRRAGIEIVYSGGFNPRPKVSYGLALSVGISSIAEFMMIDIADRVCEEDDFYLKACSSFEDETVKRLNEILPNGLEVFRARVIDDKSPSIMSVVKSHAFEVKANRCPEQPILEEAINSLKAEKKLLVKHKDKEKWVEIKEAVIDLSIRVLNNKEAIFYLLLAVGGESTLRPEILMEKLTDRLNTNNCEIVDICRIGQYVNRDIPLIDIYDFYEGVKMGSEPT